MRNPMSIPEHEPFPGVVIVYGEDGGVYISDEHGEIAMWTYEEFIEDPDACTAALHAVGLAARGEFDKIRALISRPVVQLRRTPQPGDLK
jgi:hypothetical protein